MLKGAGVGLAICLMVSGCKDATTPKPRGYFRIEHAEPSYRKVHPPCPVGFELPQNAGIERIAEEPATEGSCYFNVVYPELNARWHMTLLELAPTELSDRIEDAHQLAFSHDIKAHGIGRKRFSFPEHQVHGVFFELDGPVASPLQFYATDSIRYFVRGSLYFNHVPNPDSLAPSIDRVREDARHLIESMEWNPA